MTYKIYSIFDFFDPWEFLITQVPDLDAVTGASGHEDVVVITGNPAITLSDIRGNVPPDDLYPSTVTVGTCNQSHGRNNAKNSHYFISEVKTQKLSTNYNSGIKRVVQHWIQYNEWHRGVPVLCYVSPMLPPLHPARILYALSLASAGKSLLPSRGGYVHRATTYSNMQSSL